MSGNRSASSQSNLRGAGTPSRDRAAATAAVSVPPAISTTEGLIDMLKALQGSAFAKRTRTYLRSDDGKARMLAFAAAMLFVAAPAHAAVGGGSAISAFLQNLVNVLTGTVGQLIAVLAIIGVGIGAIRGRRHFGAESDVK